MGDSKNSKAAPRVLYLAAGYYRPGGVEVYLLHYATEMRRLGFDTRIVVFDALPKAPHWCLQSLHDRGIAIESLEERVAWRAKVACALTYVPWCVRRAGGAFRGNGVSECRRTEDRSQKTEDRGQKTEDRGQKSEVRGQKSEVRGQKSEVRGEREDGTLTPALSPQGRGGCSASSPSPASPLTSHASLLHYWIKRLEVRELARMIERSRPDVIHVKGRLIAEVWPVLPPERTVFHIATAGARDASWTDAEVAAFRKFIERAARVFAPGAQVAKRFKREFGIERDVTPVFTMAPDAFPAMPEMRQAERGKGPLRFGYLGRFAAGKGIPEILAALQALASRGTPPPFVFAGEGPLEALIRDGITRNHLKHVTVVRVISPVTALAEMDVLVLPSESEAMPLVLVEALMCGRPCLATAVGGVPDLIRDGVEGILLADGRPETLEAGMGRFLAMPAPEVAGYRSRGRARYEERCLPGRVAAEVAGHYREIMERASRQ